MFQLLLWIYYILENRKWSYHAFCVLDNQKIHFCFSGSFSTRHPQPMYSILASNIVLYCTTCETITTTGSLKGKYFQCPYHWLTVVCSSSKVFFYLCIFYSASKQANFSFLMNRSQNHSWARFTKVEASVTHHSIDIYKIVLSLGLIAKHNPSWPYCLT